MAISRALGLRRSRRTGHRFRGALRFCAALWMLFSVAYTPIHLYLEPHSDEADAGTTAAPSHAGALAATQGEDGNDHHGRHPAAQHKFKVTQSARAVVSEMMPTQAMEWVDPHEGCPQPQVVGFSGLSPPELSRSWQFIFRAALPVRAPSFLS